MKFDKGIVEILALMLTILIVCYIAQFDFSYKHSNQTTISKGNK